MKVFSYFLLVFVLSTLNGCGKADLPDQPLCRVVTTIDVTAAHNGTVSHYIYSHSDKMETLLNYLRMVHPDASTDMAPDTFRADAYQITVSFSDGNHSTYYQIYNEFLKKDDGSWMRIDADQGATLYPILCSMPTDR